CNFLDDLPLIQLLRPGKTDLFAGLRTAFDLAQTWPKGSTTLVLLSDGDTLPDRGMPEPPASIGKVWVLGVGSEEGVFIDGHPSRQDEVVWDQVARRLRGWYHNCTNSDLPWSLRAELGASPQNGQDTNDQDKTALAAAGVGSLLLVLLPLLLSGLGT